MTNIELDAYSKNALNYALGAALALEDFALAIPPALRLSEHHFYLGHPGLANLLYRLLGHSIDHVPDDARPMVALRWALTAILAPRDEFEEAVALAETMYPSDPQPWQRFYLHTTRGFYLAMVSGEGARDQADAELANARQAYRDHVASGGGAVTRRGRAIAEVRSRAEGRRWFRRQRALRSIWRHPILRTYPPLQSAMAEYAASGADRSALLTGAALPDETFELVRFADVMDGRPVALRTASRVK